MFLLQHSEFVEDPADIQDGFFQVFPLIFHYGYKEPGSNVMLYIILLVTRLAQTVAPRMEDNQQIRKTNSFHALHCLGNCDILFRCC